MRVFDWIAEGMPLGVAFIVKRRVYEPGWDAVLAAARSVEQDVEGLRAFFGEDVEVEFVPWDDPFDELWLVDGHEEIHLCVGSDGVWVGAKVCIVEVEPAALCNP